MGVAAPGFEPEQIERATLRCMMQIPNVYTAAVERLSPEHFQNPVTRLIFNELVAEWGKNVPYELVLFSERLALKNKLDAAGGRAAISEIFYGPCSEAAFPYYVNLLDEGRKARLFVKAAEDGISRAEHHDEEAISSTLSKLTELSLSKRETISFSKAVADKMNRIEFGEPDGDLVRTGLSALDSHSPLRRGDLPLIAGERKSGKSILSLSIAENVARDGVPVLYFSLEDRIPKVIDRIFAGVSRVPMHKHHMKKLTDRDVTACCEASLLMDKLPISIRDDVYDLTAILAAIRQAVARKEAGLVIVDYVQLVKAKAETRREEVELVSREFRRAAMDLNTPIILLCQLNKEGETRETKALEMDATAMWRLEVVEDEPCQRIISIPWQRNGESGIASRVTFLGEIARVENAAPQSQAA